MTRPSRSKERVIIPPLPIGDDPYPRPYIVRKTQPTVKKVGRVWVTVRKAKP